MFILPVGELMFTERLNGAQHGEGRNRKVTLSSTSSVGFITLSFLVKGSFYEKEHELMFQAYFREF